MTKKQGRTGSFMSPTQWLFDAELAVGWNQYKILSRLEQEKKTYNSALGFLMEVNNWFKLKMLWLNFVFMEPAVTDMPDSLVDT